MELFEDEGPGPGNAHDYSVGEITGAVKRVIEGEFGRVRVRGEVGRVTHARSGHLYFDLKDERNTLSAVSWKGQVARLSHMPEEGMEVIATGKVTTFGPQSRYQLTVEDIAPAGAGALMAMLEKRRKSLEGEGLFAAERKRPLPYLPQVIGVITSPTGAVIRDILHRLADRFPRHVLVWPVAVQGQTCAPEVVRAIEGFNALQPGGPIPRPDVLIVARGGGSVEDLWGFNEEAVVRAAAASGIPLISAVGHETDITLIDHASDRRAPTPTAAAEMAVPVRADLMRAVEQLGLRLAAGTEAAVTRRRQRLADIARALPRPEALLATPRQRLDIAGERLPGALTRVVDRKQLALARVPLSPGLLTRVREGAAARLDRVSSRLAPGLQTVVTARRHRLERLRLSPQPLERQVTDGRARLARAAERLEGAERRLAERRQGRLESAARLLETLSYKATLQRGYAVVRDGERVITTTAAAATAERLEIEFADGRFVPEGDGGGSDSGGSGGSPRRKPAPKPPEQGSLF
ncbi:exodeoxyribonuclease VII large subunit [Pseudoroseicyclus tamaricis]|uniref:Exodeoxyribonuclease 7 large subunit n=1 Tax=Pseudoroseicyclus tamaricis TaxID=2705421 RepID=A0A6B2JTN6_9RHOB|nr:exodeoxyribonuclease VII large subunit [Pseudoroseicyclus tamaricis]NDV01917.1 exodeoxyribonuclease VII large subunit [Pseudoroseicyclus tamaricis]